MVTPEEFIKTIRESFVGSERVYTEGSCYQFYRILKSVYPQAISWYNMDHVITEIDGRFYDITGQVYRKRHLAMSEHYPHPKVRNIKSVVLTLTDNCKALEDGC